MRLESDPQSAERWSLFACTIIAAVLWIGPYALRADLFINDAAHHIFWLYQYADPELFRGDLSIPYFHTSAPWGYRGLYAIVAPLMDVLLAAEILSSVLLIGSLWLAWKIGASGDDTERPWQGLLVVVGLVILLRWSVQKDLLPPLALQRTFALPLLLLTLWALVSRRYAWVGASWLAAALFYPVVLPVQGLTAAVVFLRDIIRDKRMPAWWVFNGIAGGLALAIAAFGMPVPPEVGPPFSYVQAMSMPEFGPHGRLVMYQESWVGDWLRGHRTGIGWSPYTLLLIGLATGAAWVLGKRRRIPFAAWVMAIVGIGIWAAMRLFPEQLMFGLYLPNRHSRWAVGVFGMLAIGVGAAALIEVAARHFGANVKESTPRLRRWVAVSAPIAVTATLLPWAMSVLNRPVDTDLENVYAFIATLPKDTLVAAHPDLADFVPVRARRSVLTSTEISMAWMENYYKQMKPRVEASLRAAYATRIDEMDRELEPLGVDVMLTGPAVWRTQSYFAPFDDLVRDLQARGAVEGYVLRSPPADRVLFRSGEYYVIRVGNCRGGDCR
jgi:hypothetical protein